MASGHATPRARLWCIICGSRSRRIRRLHRASQGQRLPLAAHRRDRARRPRAGSADPHPRMHQPRRTGRRRPLALQGRPAQRRNAVRRKNRLAAPDPGTGKTELAVSATSGASSNTPCSMTRFTCSRPQGQGDRPAQRRDAGGFRLPRCTPIWATARAAPRWTAAWCRSTTTCRTASASKSSPSSRARQPRLDQPGARLFAKLECPRAKCAPGSEARTMTIASPGRVPNWIGYCTVSASSPSTRKSWRSGCIFNKRTTYSRCHRAQRDHDASHRRSIRKSCRPGDRTRKTKGIPSRDRTCRKSRHHRRWREQPDDPNRHNAATRYRGMRSSATSRATGGITIHREDCTFMLGA